MKSEDLRVKSVTEREGDFSCYCYGLKWVSLINTSSETGRAVGSTVSKLKLAPFLAKQLGTYFA